METRISRGVLDVHPGLLIPAIVVLSEFGPFWLLAAAPIVAIMRDLVRYANGRLGDPARPANVLPGEKRQAAVAGAVVVAAGPEPSTAIARAPPGRLRRHRRAPVQPVPARRPPRPSCPPRARFAFTPATPKPSTSRHAEEPPAVSDDLAQSPAPSNETPDASRSTSRSRFRPPYVQLTEITATPLEAADAIERRDDLGRIPVVVRIRRQPPIQHRGRS